MSEFAQFISYGGSAERREQSLARKNARYHRDQEHREAKKAAARGRYKPVKQPKVGQRGRNKPRPLLYEGEVILLVSFGVLSDETGLSKAALRRYEKSGVIPSNHMVDPRGRRWYPKPFVEFLGELLRGQAARREPLRVLKKRVEQAWGIARSHPEMPILKKEDENATRCRRIEAEVEVEEGCEGRP